MPTAPKAGQVAADTGAPAPTLAPLATPQQVVKAVTVGRRDPFARVVDPKMIAPPAAPSQASPKTPLAAGPAAPAVLAWPPGLFFDGVLQSFSESEAMVRYIPAEEKGGATRFGSLRVGDTGTSDQQSLLPPGWQVAAIDGEQGLLVLRKGEQTVKRQL
jgi:hypothetical protein